MTVTAPRAVLPARGEVVPTAVFNTSFESSRRGTWRAVVPLSPAVVLAKVFIFNNIGPAGRTRELPPQYRLILKRVLGAKTLRSVVARYY
jgi:hypothetical protein